MFQFPLTAEENYKIFDSTLRAINVTRPVVMSQCGRIKGFYSLRGEVIFTKEPDVNEKEFQRFLKRHLRM